MRADLTDDCGSEAGRVFPLVDRNRCEAKEDCVDVCPYDVFEIHPVSRADRSSMSLLGKLKAWTHGNKQAFVVRPEACHAGQLCIEVCPENALTLIPNRQS